LIRKTKFLLSKGIENPKEKKKKTQKNPHPPPNQKPTPKQTQKPPPPQKKKTKKPKKKKKRPQNPPPPQKKTPPPKKNPPKRYYISQKGWGGRFLEKSGRGKKERDDAQALRKGLQPLGETLPLKKKTIHIQIKKKDNSTGEVTVAEGSHGVRGCSRKSGRRTSRRESPLTAFTKEGEIVCRGQIKAVTGRSQEERDIKKKGKGGGVKVETHGQEEKSLPARNVKTFIPLKRNCIFQGISAIQQGEEERLVGGGVPVPSLAGNLSGKVFHAKPNSGISWGGVYWE